MSETSLLINGAFALRQQRGLPVFSTIETKTKPHDQNFIDKYGKLGTLADRKLRIKTDHSLDLHKLERIIITPNAKGYLSTYFLDFMREFNVPIYFVNGRGMIESCFMPSYYKKPSLILKQCEVLSNGKNIEIAKHLIKLKIKTQRVNNLIPDLVKCNTIRDILVTEAHASKIYFDNWVLDLPNRFNFKGRFGRTLKKNAVDPINTTLNLGYGLLAQQMSEILLERGFELSIGLMHYHETTYWNRLSYDMVEPFRVWIEQAVKDMAINSIIEPEDFKFSQDRSKMILRDKHLDKVINQFMETLEPLEHKSLPMIRKVEAML